MNFNLDNIAVGDKIPDLLIEPITRPALKLYADASGDFNPIHIDSDYAKSKLVLHASIHAQWLL